jgi:hypothetical protein
MKTLLDESEPGYSAMMITLLSYSNITQHKTAGLT